MLSADSGVMVTTETNCSTYTNGMLSTYVCYDISLCWNRVSDEQFPCELLSNNCSAVWQITGSVTPDSTYVILLSRIKHFPSNELFGKQIIFIFLLSLWFVLRMEFTTRSRGCLWNQMRSADIDFWGPKLAVVRRRAKCAKPPPETLLTMQATDQFCVLLHMIFHMPVSYLCLAVV